MANEEYLLRRTLEQLAARAESILKNGLVSVSSKQGPTTTIPDYYGLVASEPGWILKWGFVPRLTYSERPLLDIDTSYMGHKNRPIEVQCYEPKIWQVAFDFLGNYVRLIGNGPIIFRH